MNLYPAIDIKDGACVRLLHGDMATATQYNSDPGAQAREFAAAGCKWIHVVNLDAAFNLQGTRIFKIIGDIVATGIPVQFGGGIREMSLLDKYIEMGVARVVLGTVALKNPGLVKRAAKRFPNKIAVAADAKNGMVAVHGWVEDSEITATELGKRFEDCGVAAVIFTDISRDGALTGVNIKATAELARALSIPVIASGGVAGMKDITALAEDKSGIEGVIVGRAIYENRLDVKAALRVLEAA